MQVTHPMGMALWVTGRRAVEVFAYMENYDLAVDLVNAFSFRLDNGATGTMASSGAMRPHQRLDQGFVYTGSKGVLRQDIAGGRLEAQYNDGTATSLQISLKMKRILRTCRHGGSSMSSWARARTTPPARWALGWLSSWMRATGQRQ